MADMNGGMATMRDLSKETGKAELIAGRIVHLMPTGRKPNRIAGRIFRSLDDHGVQNGDGEAYTDNMGYAVPILTSGRQSFSPDASYYRGRLPENAMRFIEGPPDFAAEVRSENDYGPEAESRLAQKRADYFEAGTTVVWDVDPLDACVRVYYRTNPGSPTTFRSGEMASAEPAVPGWSVAVDWLFGLQS